MQTWRRLVSLRIRRRALRGQAAEQPGTPGSLCRSRPQALGDVRWRPEACRTDRAAGAAPRWHLAGGPAEGLEGVDRVRRHAILQQLPTFAEERQAARQRIAARVADRRARPALPADARPAAGRRTTSARPALAGAPAGPSLCGHGFPCDDIGAAAAGTRSVAAGRRWRTDAPDWRGYRPAGAIPAGGGARPAIPCSDIGAAGRLARRAPDVAVDSWPGTISARPARIWRHATPGHAPLWRHWPRGQRQAAAPGLRTKPAPPGWARLDSSISGQTPTHPL